MSTRIKGMIAANLAAADKLEASAFELRDALGIKNAIGAQLDLLGRVYNVKRQGRSDGDYRKAIQIRAAVAVNGTPDEICSYLRDVYGYTSIRYTSENVVPHYNMAFFIDGYAPTQITIKELESLSPAGVGAYPADYEALEDGTLECMEDGGLLLTPRA